METQFELGGRKLEGPQLFMVPQLGGPHGPPGKLPGPMERGSDGRPQGPGVLDPELPLGLGTNPWEPEPGPHGTSGGGGPPPGVTGGPGDGPWKLGGKLGVPGPGRVGVSGPAEKGGPLRPGPLESSGPKM